MQTQMNSANPAGDRPTQSSEQASKLKKLLWAIDTGRVVCATTKKESRRDGSLLSWILGK
jgi:hypothetical protein